MKILTLTRKTNIESKGVIGDIRLDGTTYHTIEQPWNDNKPFHSCIPVGIYELIPWRSPTYGHCYVAVNEELNVYFSANSPNRPSLGRYKCLYFHRGNYARNFKGCGGVGERYISASDMVTNTVQTCRIVNGLIVKKGIHLLHIVKG